VSPRCSISGYATTGEILSCLPEKKRHTKTVAKEYDSARRINQTEQFVSPVVWPSKMMMSHGLSVRGGNRLTLINHSCKEWKQIKDVLLKIEKRVLFLFTAFQFIVRKQQWNDGHSIGGLILCFLS
jgi:hypothetical protein